MLEVGTEIILDGSKKGTILYYCPEQVGDCIIKVNQPNGSVTYEKHNISEFVPKGDDTDGDTISVKDLNTIAPVIQKREEAQNDTKSENDMVNHPAHYTEGKYEVIDFIDTHGISRSFCLGNAIKYLARAGKKDPDKKIEDIRKAIWYLKHEVSRRDIAKYTNRISIDTYDFIKDKGLSSSVGMAICMILAYDDSAIKSAIATLEDAIEKGDI